MSNKLTLVIDGNWLLMSRYFMSRESFRKGQPEGVLLQASEGLADTMAQSISVLMRQFQDAITNVILVSDNHSWRKELSRPSSISSEAYKGTRSQDDEYDWTYVFKSVSILAERMKKLGITTCNAYGVEGDDWCWWWSRRLNAEGTNVLLWTSDEDVKQLVQQDEETGAFTAWYEKSKGLVLNSCMKESDQEDPESELDAFMMPIKATNEVVDKLSRIVKVTYINPSNIINKKILIGDASDNILPVFTYIKGTKVYKATQRDWEKIIDFDTPAYGQRGWTTGLKNMYTEVFNVKKKLLGNEFTSCDDFKEHILYNRKLVWLDESQIPENVKGQMIVAEYKETPAETIHDIKFNWRTIANKEQENSIVELFEGEPNFF